MAQGRILRGIGGFYTIQGGDGIQHTLRARGLFRLQNITPLPGDFVEFEKVEGEADAAMTRILERKNALTRPRVANVDILLIVVAAQKPQPDFLLVDRLCLSALQNHVQPMVILNKCDLASEMMQRNFQNEYAAFSAACVSARTGAGIAALRAVLRGKVCCFAGQSGVGKSSLANALLGVSLQTGDLSNKTKRGKHTTRATELIPVLDGALVDTPGFSMLETNDIEPAMLAQWYPEFAVEEPCRFAGCLHDKEPGCAIKESVEQGIIPRCRWERYQTLLAEVQEKWRNRYE